MSDGDGDRQGGDARGRKEPGQVPDPKAAPPRRQQSSDHSRENVKQN
jgi:hypothetical protein